MTILSAISSSSILPTRALHTTSLSHHQSLSNSFNKHENLHKPISSFRIKAAKLPPEKWLLAPLICPELVDKVLDKTGMKGTGKWTVQQAADLSVAAPTIASSLDARFCYSDCLDRKMGRLRN